MIFLARRSAKAMAYRPLPLSMLRGTYIEHAYKRYILCAVLRSRLRTKMWGRFTVKATWAEIVALSRITMDAPPHNLRPR
jgi:hypothetical protein